MARENLALCLDVGPHYTGDAEYALHPSDTDVQWPAYRLPHMPTYV